jgi:hypothetical protein
VRLEELDLIIYPENPAGWLHSRSSGLGRGELSDTPVVPRPFTGTGPGAGAGPDLFPARSRFVSPDGPASRARDRAATAWRPRQRPGPRERVWERERERGRGRGRGPPPREAGPFTSPSPAPEPVPVNVPFKQGIAPAPGQPSE